MRKYITAGLAALLPIFLTFLIVSFLINLLTSPFLEQTERFLERFQGLQPPPVFGKHTLFIALTSKMIILLVLFGSIVLIGFAGEHFIIHALRKLGDRFLKKIPFINRIYSTSKELVQSLFSSSSTSFSQVVLVPFPQKGRLSYGFVANPEVKIKFPYQSSREMVSVFVPGAPNPTGCFFLCQKEHLQYSNMKVDEAMAFVVSCGLNLPKVPHES